MNIGIGLLIPFLGTVLGAAMVFFMKNTINKKIEKLLLGFAAGVMISASIWSLLLPSLEMVEEQNGISWLPATIGFMLGIIFLLILDSIIPHLHLNNKEPEGIKTKLKDEIMLVLAVTLHNIPEGMAMGVVIADIIVQGTGNNIAGVLSLAIGLAIQNFPEGTIISTPLRSQGISKLKAFGYGVLSGIVEPIAAVITIILSNSITSMLPYLLAFAAGAMMYVVIEELIPESQTDKHSNIGTIGVALGFVIMMILDVALG